MYTIMQNARNGYGKKLTTIQEIFGGDLISVPHRLYQKYRNQLATENFLDYSIGFYGTSGARDVRT